VICVYFGQWPGVRRAGLPRQSPAHAGPAAPGAALDLKNGSNSGNAARGRGVAVAVLAVIQVVLCEEPRCSRPRGCRCRWAAELSGLPP